MYYCCCRPRVEINPAAMEADAVELLTTKGKFPMEQALAVAEAMDVTMGAKQWVTVPILDARLALVDGRCTAMEAKLAALETKWEARFAAFEARMDQKFTACVCSSFSPS